MDLSSGLEAVRSQVLSGYVCWQTQRITFILLTAGDDFTHANQSQKDLLLKTDQETTS